MPSTFSPNLLLELQQTGENQNTWGIILNSDLSDVDAAAGGRLNLSVAGNSNITLNDTQAANAFHFLTGALTGNIDYIFPSRGRVFVVNNGTSGAFTVTVKTAAGTGIVVPQGTRAMILTNPDTTSASSVLNYLPSLSLGSALGLASGGTNGNLTASNGGLLYSTASALAILAGTATAGQIPRSGASAAPAWSTSTYPNTTVQGDLIYASADNVISGLAKNTSATRYASNTGTNNAPAWAQVNLANGVTGQLPVANAATSLVTSLIQFVIDGGGSTITTGTKGGLDICMPYAGTIQSATLLADQSGSIVIDVWKKAYATSSPPTVANTIVASAPPTLSSAQSSQDATLTGWTTTFAANDVFRINVNSVSSITRVSLGLKIVKT